MKYLVILVGYYTELESGEVCIDSEPFTCNDSREVCKIIRSMPAGHDWSVFELVNGKYKRRSLTFKWDGKCPYDVVIQ